MNPKIAGKNKTGWNVLFVFLAAASICLLSPVPRSFGADDDMISLPSKKSTDKAATAEKVQSSETAPASTSMLQGVFYDFKRMKNGNQNADFKGIPETGAYTEARVAPMLKILKAFVNGDWRREYDGQGRVHFPDLEKYYCSPTRAWNSTYFYSAINANDLPQALGCGSEVKPASWCCIYSGYVKAPFTGKFRFVGYGDDFLVIRFGQQVVLDYGWFSATLGEKFDENLRTKLSSSSTSQIVRSMPKINEPESSFYSGYNPVFYFPSLCSEHGVAAGKIVSVRAGDVIPIDIMTSDLGEGFKIAVFIEQLNTNGEPMNKNSSTLPLFRTTTDLPEGKVSDFPEFSQTGPVWKVVDRFGRPITAPKNSTAQSTVKDKTTASSAAAKDKTAADKTTAASTKDKTAATASTSATKENSSEKKTASGSTAKKKPSTDIQGFGTTSTSSGPFGSSGTPSSGSFGSSGTAASGPFGPSSITETTGFGGFGSPLNTGSTSGPFGSSANTSKEKQQTSAQEQKTVQKTQKVVKTENKGNTTIRTTTEYRDDVTIETKVTTEKDGSKTVETTVITETKDGKVVKKTETTTTTTTTETVSEPAGTSAPKQTANTANTEKKSAAEEKKQTATQTSGRKVSPFGISQRPVDDD